MDDLLEWFLKKENKNTCRLVGILLVIPFISFYFGGGFPQGYDGHGIILSMGWFREIFMILLVLLFLVGLILIVAGFSKRRNIE